MQKLTIVDQSPSGSLRSASAKGIRAVIVAIASIVIFLSCDVEMPFAEDDVNVRKFVISAGEHYSTPRLIETLNEKSLAFKATFDQSAMYDLKDPSLQTNINKLMGFADCSANHHENSARFGWAWNNASLEIYAYCYVDGVRISQLAGTVKIGEENLYEIVAGENEYVFSINGERKATIERTPTCQEGINYMLYPYFGGSVPAPHDVTVKIEVVE